MVSLSNESYGPVTRLEGNNDIHGLLSLTGCLEWASLLFKARRHRTAGPFSISVPEQAPKLKSGCCMISAEPSHI
jgi:hypothetical protein